MSSFIPKLLVAIKTWLGWGHRMRVEVLSLPTLQVTAFLILFLLGGQIENQLLSTGAFEVYLNGKSNVSTYLNSFSDIPPSSSLLIPSLSPSHLPFFSGEPVWSKLESGRLPSLSEMKGFIDEPQFNSFTTDEETSS